MLQATEYNIIDYLKWFYYIKNFKNIQQRKTLKITIKSAILLLISYVFVFTMILLLFILYDIFNIYMYVLLLILIFFTFPYILAHIIIIPLFIIQIFQQLLEYVIIYNVKKKLLKHKGYKIAIAGSFGKTTMREILKSVLSISKNVACPIHNYNTPLGIAKFVSGLKNNEDILIFEFGEYYPGDIKTLCNMVCPDIGIITGINEAHLQKFKTIENTINTIYELADFFNNKPIYINGDSKYALKKVRNFDFIYTQNKLNDWAITKQHTDIYGTSFTISKDNITLNIKTKLLGLHQIGPISVAIDIAYNLKFTKEKIEQAISNIKPFEHRMQPIYNDNWVLIDDSYNGNLDGAKVAIAFLSSLKESNIYYVTPGFVEMGNMTKEIHIYLGRLLAQSNIKTVILIKTPVSQYIEEGLKKYNFKGNLIYFENMLQFLKIMPNIVVKNDIILIQNDWPEHYYFTT